MFPSHAIYSTSTDFITLYYLSPLECRWTSQGSLCPFMSKLVCGGAMPCDKCPEGVIVIFLTPWPGMLRGVRQERHQHEQAGGHLTRGEITRLWHEDPACHQGLRLRFRKGNWPGWRQPDGCLAPMYGIHVKRLLSLLLPFVLLFVWFRMKMGAHVRLTVFTAGSVWGCVYLTISVALWHRP